MPFDGIVISSVVWELSGLLTDGRIEKINQTERDEIVLSCHSSSGKQNLLISSNPSNPRIHFTGEHKENPLVAPQFCMVLRKHLKGGRIKSVVQEGYDRILTITAEVFDDLEGFMEKHLIVEIMGKYSNIILTDKNGIILDAIRHIDSGMSSVREVLPGRKYISPPPQVKCSPTDTSALTGLLSESDCSSVKQFLLSSVSGFSPMLCSAICEKAGILPQTKPGSLSPAETDSLDSVLFAVSSDISNHIYRPCLFTEEGTDKPLDFHCLAVTETGVPCRHFSTVNMMLDAFYTERDSLFRLEQKKSAISRKLQSAMDHCIKKKNLYDETLAQKDECEDLRIRGELIKSYIYLIKPGDESLTCINFFDENQPEITIPLDKNLTPALNGVQCFKKYRKQKNAIESAEKFLAEITSELFYLDNVFAMLENCTDSVTLAEIRDELCSTGYLKEDFAEKKGKQGKKSSQSKKSKSTLSAPISTLSSDGFEILIGKNNRQNDLLTLKTARRDDMWLHLKDAPGSHVIIRARDGFVSDTAIAEAAAYAAGYSSLKNETKAPVDYTLACYVKKPSGARPGMVTYTNQKTIYVVSKKV